MSEGCFKFHRSPEPVEGRLSVKNHGSNIGTCFDKLSTTVFAKRLTK
jgi:hypothetical protein